MLTKKVPAYTVLLTFLLTFSICFGLKMAEKSKAKEIEETIIRKVNITNKTPQYKIYEQLKSGFIKIFCDNENKINILLGIKNLNQSVAVIFNTNITVPSTLSRYQTTVSSSAIDVVRFTAQNSSSLEAYGYYQNLTSRN